MIAETGRNPRYLTHCNLRGVKATTIEAAPLAEAEVIVLAVPSAVYGAVVEIARRRRAGPVADEGARPGDGRSALDARAGAAGRGADGTEHRRRDRPRPARPRR